MNKNSIKEAVSKALEEKGKRKFKQTMDLGINFQNIDFTKQDKRVNVTVTLPKGVGKEKKVAVFADGQMATDAKNAGCDLVITGDKIPDMAKDQAKLKSLLEYEIIASPQLMAVVGKHLGQFLGTRGKLPKPIMGGSVKDAAERAKRMITIKTKGKFLPVLHCRVGSEDMAPEEITENIAEVYDKIKAKVGGEQYISSMYVKLTMGKPIQIALK